MSMSYWIEALDPPLDVEAMHARVRALPCVVERVRDNKHIYVLAGDRETEQQLRAGETPQLEPPIFGIEGGSVWLALQWSDNRYAHGAYLLFWVLDHHHCQGVEGDWGSKLADNDAIRRELRRWRLTPVLAPEARRDWVRAQLVGRLLRRLEWDGSDVTLWFTAGEGEDRGLWFPLARCALVTADPRTTGLDPDERMLVGLHQLILCIVAQVGWSDDGTLNMEAVGGDGLRLASGWSDREEGWRLIDPSGELLIEAGNGGALHMRGAQLP